MPRYVRSTRLPASQEAAFDWHVRPGALERLSPPFVPARAEPGGRGIDQGTEVTLRLLPGAWPLRPRWRVRHDLVDPPREFRDRQVKGPFADWSHRHCLEPDGPSASVLTDDVAYRLPLGPLGAALAGPSVRQRLDRAFAYRHRVTVADLTAHAQARSRGVRQMHVAVTGSSGLIGSALVAFLETGGHRVTRIVRRAPGEGEIAWDPTAAWIDAEGLRGVDAVVHLAGETIASVRWTDAKKRRVRESRTRGTSLLAETVAKMDDGPRTLVSASGITYYGDRGDEELGEDSGPGVGFLPDVSVQWETATAPAADAGIRVVNLRTGVVQDPRGGALAKQLPLFRLGGGGRIGSGQQWMSWISLDDIVGLYHHALTSDGLSGPVNAVAPQPVTNAEFTRTLGDVLGRPTVLPVPRAAPMLALGEMAKELLFYSLRARPHRALASGYAFRHPTLEGCLRDVLGRPLPAGAPEDPG